MAFRVRRKDPSHPGRSSESRGLTSLQKKPYPHQQECFWQAWGWRTLGMAGRYPCRTAFPFRLCAGIAPGRLTMQPPMPPRLLSLLYTLSGKENCYRGQSSMMAAVSSMDSMYVGLAVIDSVVSCMHVRSVLPIGSGDAAVQAAQPITKQHSNRPSCCACAAMWAANAKVGYAKKDQLLHSDRECMLCQFL